VYPSAVTPVLALSGITKRYPGVVALNNVAFSVIAGEIHALLGENGAGKTTLVAIASGTVSADEGTIVVRGSQVVRMTPLTALGLGMAIVHQEPALLPDLTVLENMTLAVPRRFRSGVRTPDRVWARQQLDRVGCDVALGARIDEVGVADRALIELAKAFSIDPDILILDEPTARLGGQHIDRLFELVRGAAARGAAIIYITHRLPEVRQLADRVTVLRDGVVRGTFHTTQVSDDELIELITGRTLEAIFPPKFSGRPSGDAALEVAGLSGHGLENVAISVRKGEIVGLAGIEGNGQSELLRSIAGLHHATGELRIQGGPVRVSSPTAAHAAGIAYIPADRHGEGIFRTLSVRENIAVGALERFRRLGIIRRDAERRAVHDICARLAVRTPSLEQKIENLSGGNQQKVVIGRAVLKEPRVLLVDEPTQGVDAGARVEIYGILRDIANQGVPVVVRSSDSLELEGLCDRVYVFSRGHIIGELAGGQVTERAIAETMVTSTAQRRLDPVRATVLAGASNVFALIARAIQHDWFPSAVLFATMLILGILTYNVSPRVLSEFNVASALTLLATLAFISMGQTTVVLTGGIDISVGPLAGLLVVIASFFLVAGAPMPWMLIGLLIMLVAAILQGVLNGALVWFGRLTPVAATLAAYIALQGLSLILRPEPGGSILPELADAIETKIGPIPLAFLLAVLAALASETVLRATRVGIALRAVGSNPAAAERLGVSVRLVTILAYVTGSIFVFVGGVLLMAQISIGDPVGGISYTLWSITAVVLGGTSLFGGRGSYIGTLFGAALIQQIFNATVFLGLGQVWQFWFLGLLTLGAALIYSQARRLRRPA
jgi:ribose transport system ATP-binding protein